jgi:hypothetical protein
MPSARCKHNCLQTTYPVPGTRSALTIRVHSQAQSCDAEHGLQLLLCCCRPIQARCSLHLGRLCRCTGCCSSVLMLLLLPDCNAAREAIAASRALNCNHGRLPALGCQLLNWQAVEVRHCVGQCSAAAVPCADCGLLLMRVICWLILQLAAARQQLGGFTLLENARGCQHQWCLSSMWGPQHTALTSAVIPLCCCSCCFACLCSTALEPETGQPVMNQIKSCKIVVNRQLKWVHTMRAVVSAVGCCPHELLAQGQC